MELVYPYCSSPVTACPIRPGASRVQGREAVEFRDAPPNVRGGRGH